jgi:hypothetical protein
MRTKGFWIATAVVVLAVAVSGVAFVKTSQPVAGTAATMAGAGATCPTTGKMITGEAGGMPENCSEIHNQAMAAGTIGKADHIGAELQLAAAVSGMHELTPEECQKVIASLGYECNEEDLLKCATRIQELGFCTDMSTQECADKLAKGLHAGAKAGCTTAESAGACCLKGLTKQADASTDAQVSTAVAQETTTQSGKAKQCDWTKSACETDTK